jgi:hypothetical protein
LLSWTNIDTATTDFSVYLLVVSKGLPKQKFPREWW